VYYNVCWILHDVTYLLFGYISHLLPRGSCTAFYHFGDKCLILSYVSDNSEGKVAVSSP